MTNPFPEPRPEIRRRLAAGDASLARAMQTRDLALLKGDALVETGKPLTSIYRLMTGWMARERTLDDGRQQIITMFVPGDLLGLKAIFFARQPDALQCLTPATVQTLDYAEAQQLAAESADVAFRLMWQLAEDERRLHNWVVALGRGDALERVARLLLEFRGRLTYAGLAHDGNRYRMPLTQKQLGDHMGLTIVHVNRTIRVLRERGICTVAAGAVTITDLAALVALAGPMLDIFERESEAFGAAAPG